MTRAKRRRVAWALAGGLLITLVAPGIGGMWEGRTGGLRGVNDAGAEFYGPQTPRGKPLWLSSQRTRSYFAQKGLSAVRLPVRWESLQPELNGPLYPPALDQLRQYAREAQQLGIGVVLELHNYARYSITRGQGFRELVVGDSDLPSGALADCWNKLAAALKDEPGIVAYGLMNEPHDIVTKRWEIASQEALEAIRRAGDGRLVLVPGSNWSACHTWVMCHGHKSWITDPANNFAYEAHLYFSLSHAAYPLTFEQEQMLDPDVAGRTRERLAVFVDWCQENGVRGFIGETGCPPEPGWCSILDEVLSELDRVHMGATLWAAGERWPADYKLLVQPDVNFQSDKPQMKVLAQHARGKASLWSDWVWGYERCGARLRAGWRDCKGAIRSVLRLII